MRIPMPPACAAVNSRVGAIFGRLHVFLATLSQPPYTFPKGNPSWHNN